MRTLNVLEYLGRTPRPSIAVNRSLAPFTNQSTRKVLMHMAASCHAVPRGCGAMMPLIPSVIPGCALSFSQSEGAFLCPQFHLRLPVQPSAQLQPVTCAAPEFRPRSPARTTGALPHLSAPTPPTSSRMYSAYTSYPLVLQASRTSVKRPCPFAESSTSKPAAAVSTLSARQTTAPTPRRISTIRAPPPRRLSPIPEHLVAPRASRHSSPTSVAMQRTSQNMPAATLSSLPFIPSSSKTFLPLFRPHHASHAAPVSCAMARSPGMQGSFVGLRE